MKPKIRLLKYLQRRPNEKIVKGELFRIAKERLEAEGTTMYDETFGRYLRELEAEGKIHKHYNDKHHVVYWYEPSKYELYHYKVKQQQLV